MVIQSAPNSSPSNKSDWGSKLVSTVAEHPILFTADAVDLGAGLANAMSAASGTGGDVLKGTGFVMGGYHGVKAFVHFVNGVTNADMGYSREAKSEFTKLAGETLIATGHFCAAAGVGPVSLGFLGLGLVVTNAATLAA